MKGDIATKEDMIAITVDVVIECAGMKSAAKQVFEVAGKGARIVFFSVPSPEMM